MVVLDEYVLRPNIHVSHAEIVQDAQLRPYLTEQFDARAFGCKALSESYPINGTETKGVSPEAINNENPEISRNHTEVRIYSLVTGLLLFDLPFNLRAVLTKIEITRSCI